MAAQIALSDGYDMTVKLSNRVSCQEEVWSFYSPTEYVHDILDGAREEGSKGWAQPVYKGSAGNGETKGRILSALRRRTLKCIKSRSEEEGLD